MLRTPEKNSVGEGIVAANASWTFGGSVAETFSEQARRSTPYYEKGHELICMISDFFVRQDSVCFDIGTSHGELIGRLAERACQVR